MTRTFFNNKNKLPKLCSYAIILGSPGYGQEQTVPNRMRRGHKGEFKGKWSFKKKVKNKTLNRSGRGGVCAAVLASGELVLK